MGHILSVFVRPKQPTRKLPFTPEEIALKTITCDSDLDSVDHVVCLCNHQDRRRTDTHAYGKYPNYCTDDVRNMKIELAAKDQQISQLRLRIFELQDLPFTVEELREEITDLKKVYFVSVAKMRLYIDDIIVHRRMRS
jgi:hypothetical protein